MSPHEARINEIEHRILRAYDNVRALRTRSQRGAQGIRLSEVSLGSGSPVNGGEKIPGASGATISGTARGCDGGSLANIPMTFHLRQGGSTLATLSTTGGAYSFTGLPRDQYFDIEAIPSTSYRYAAATLSGTYCRDLPWDFPLTARYSGDTACSAQCGFMPVTISLTVTISDGGVIIPDLVLTNEPLTWDTNRKAWLTVKAWPGAPATTGCSAAGTGSAYLAVDRNLFFYVVVPACDDGHGGFRVKVDAGTSPPWPPTNLGVNLPIVPTGWASFWRQASVSGCAPSFSATVQTQTSANSGQGPGAINVTTNQASLSA